jgi:hypothetical protein
MDDLYLGKDYAPKMMIEPIDLLTYSAIIVVLVLICVACKNFKISNTRHFRGKTVSFV